MKTIKGNLELTKDAAFSESIRVEGAILSRARMACSLKVAGDIAARDIIVGNLTAKNISTGSITARNVKARNITAIGIDAWAIDSDAVDSERITAWDLTAKKVRANTIDVSDDIYVSGSLDAGFIICDGMKVGGRAKYKHLLTNRRKYRQSSK